MSRAARFVVRTAARALPVGIRERYREEWLGDIVGSADAGVRASSIAAGAVLFTATLRRDTPGVLGMPPSVAARRHARWATALLLSAMVFAFGGFVTGSFSAGKNGALEGATALWIALTVVGTVAGLTALWRAALLSSPLAKSGATTLTASLVVFASGLVIPQSNVLGVVVLPVGLLLAIIGTCIAAVASAGSDGASAPAAATIPAPSRRLPPALTISLVVAGVLLAALVLLLSSVMIWLAVIVTAGDGTRLHPRGDLGGTAPAGTRRRNGVLDHLDSVLGGRDTRLPGGRCVLPILRELRDRYEHLRHFSAVRRRRIGHPSLVRHTGPALPGRVPRAQYRAAAPRHCRAAPCLGAR